MTALDAASVLRHREPALLLGAVERPDGGTLHCASRGAGSWPWPRLLEGTAQAAGLLAGLQPGGPDESAVIAEYRDVVLGADTYEGAVVFHAVLERRLAHFWRCRCEARAGDGRVLLRARVTVAPEPT